LPDRRHVDDLVASLARGLARRTSRRTLVARLGTVLLGAAAAPVLLPIARSRAAEAPPGELGDPASCDYWRYCASNGYLCSCCGGSAGQCPPGTEMSRMAWIGTCRNPADGKQYLISYNDCCGKSSCQRCNCSRHESEMPVYRAGKANDILWCSANDTTALTCTVAVVLGVAEDAG
jgi:methylamine dehydrogenase light chain